MFLLNYGGWQMRLTSKGRYAVRAMLDLTFHSNGNPVRLQEISSRQAILKPCLFSIADTKADVL